MARLSLYTGRKTNDYNYVDRVISDYMYASGTDILVHKYLGPHDQSEDFQPGDVPDTNELTIQDVLFLENRDRRYSKEVYTVRGTYNVQDSDFDLKQFGLFLTGDTLFIEFHMNDLVSTLGRRLMAGDVLELPHLRDENTLDNGPAINHFFVVEDGSKASGGYSTTWFAHIWRAKCAPMTGAQEYKDILDKKITDPFGRETSEVIGNIMTTLGREVGINEAVVEDAKRSVSRRYFETQHYYVVPGSENGSNYPWIFAGDGEPPNGAELIGSGNRFPDAATSGSYFLRTDYEPFALFRFDGDRWVIQEQNYRESDWRAAQGILLSFINNNATSVNVDGTVEREKQALSKVVRPKADL